MMRTILAIAVTAAVLSTPAAGNEKTLGEVKQALDKLNQAFEKGDAKAAKVFMADDHMAVTPYYGGALKRDAQLATLSKTKLTEYVTGEMKMTPLGSEAVLVTYP